MTTADSSIHVRLAVWHDWPVVAEFNIRLADESEGKHLARHKIEPGVQAVLSDPHKGRYFVAEVDGRVVGQMLHTFEWSDWRNGPIWWLQSVYVHPEYRRRGVFRQLFEAVLADAQAAGVLGVRLYVEQHNSKAQDTYAALGLEPAGYHVLEKWFGDSL